MRADRAHAHIEEVYRALPLPASRRDELRVAARQDAIARLRERELRGVAIRAEIDDIARREMLLADRLAAGLLAEDAYALAANTMASERAGLESRLVVAEMRERDADLRGARTVWEAHRRLGPAMQDRLLRSVFKAIRLGPGGVAGYAFQEPFLNAPTHRPSRARAAAV